jgi:hypothetical protein
MTHPYKPPQRKFNAKMIGGEDIKGLLSLRVEFKIPPTLIKIYTLFSFFNCLCIMMMPTNDGRKVLSRRV